MAADPKKPAKSESLTIRLNPRTRFVLEFVARMRGQTITTVVERALEAAGEQARISQEFGEDTTWRDYWDISDGVRALRVAREPELFPTYEEERRLHFAQRLKEYFFSDDAGIVPQRSYIEVLWPQIDSFIDLFETTKTTDFFAAEKEIRKSLVRAGINPPKSRSGVTDPSSKYDLDDDIPF